ncbi:MAG: hypothetical protein ACHBN1_10265 [Heteroscytonema crispum UTEX LB 1556]
MQLSHLPQTLLLKFKRFLQPLSMSQYILTLLFLTAIAHRPYFPTPKAGGRVSQLRRLRCPSQQTALYNFLGITQKTRFLRKIACECKQISPKKPDFWNFVRKSCFFQGVWRSRPQILQGIRANKHQINFALQKKNL